MSDLSVRTIDCRELHLASLQRPIDLIDVRTREEFCEIRAAQARNVPLDTLDPAAIARTRTTPVDEPLYFICAVGARSAWACEIMIAAGHPNVVNVEGGTQAWYLAGLPVEQGAPYVAR
jgi:rhodanese-related sulfurtransferase